MISTLLLTTASLAALVAGAPYLGAPYYNPQVLQPYVYYNQAPVLYQSDPYQSAPYQSASYQSAPYQSAQYQSAPYQQLYTVPAQPQIFNSPQYLTEQQVYDVQPQQPVPQQEVARINQFHSEDGQGRVLYGFHGHNQARMEARDAQGRVRGSYSYIDANGHVVRMDYWDDGNGFQARGANVPKVAYDVPGFTPEVQAARDQHFKLYQQILLSSVQAQSPNQVTEEDYPYVERPDGSVASPVSQDEDDTVEVGAYPERPNNDLPSYPNQDGRFPPNNYQQPSYPFQTQDEEDPESIALDNPEFQDYGREGKSLDVKDSNGEGSNQQDNVEPVEKKEKDTEPSKEVSTTTEGKMKEEKKEIKDETKDMVKEVKEKMGDNKEDQKDDLVKDEEQHGGFSYHIQYTLGGPGHVQIQPTFQKVSSVAASETRPQQKTTSIHSVHPLPLHTMTGFTKSNPEPSAIHDMQASPQQMTMMQPAVSQMITKSFPSPVSAVHDQQTPKGAKSQ